MTRTSGFSEAARWIDEGVTSGRRRLGELHVVGDRSAVFDELAETWNACCGPNWDGYGALPVSQESLRTAYRLIESLPLGYPRPSIGAEPDGELTLEWYRSPTRLLSVSATADEALHFAAFLGPNRQFGTEAFFGELPETIAALVRRIYA